MNLFSLYRELLARVWEKKKTLIVLGIIYLLFIVLGIVFIKTPAIYSYHINLCDRYVDRVCFSNENVFVIFLERFLGNTVYLVIILCSGVHIAGLALPALVLSYRAYTFGGSLAIFFSVYKMSGALIVFVLYLPVHLLLDVIFLSSGVISFSRSKCFKFKKQDCTLLLRDFLLILALVAIVCLLEMLLLIVLFHPIGNLM